MPREMEPFLRGMLRVRALSQSIEPSTETVGGENNISDGSEMDDWAWRNGDEAEGGSGGARTAACDSSVPPLWRLSHPIMVAWFPRRHRVGERNISRADIASGPIPPSPLSS